MALATLAPIARYLESICPAESDAILLKRFARHADEAAFAEIVRRHGPAVLGVCRRILHDGHAAEDAFQVTFLLLAKKADLLRDPARLACWLHGVAFRTALKQRSWLLRRRIREQPLDETTLAAANDSDADLSDEIDAAIEQLPSKYRLPVVLCYLQGLTNAQAAAVIGCPSNTIATRLARARGRLRERLTKQGLTVAVSSSLATGTARSAVRLISGMNGLSNEIATLLEGVQSAMFWKKLKIAVAVTAIASLTGIGAGRMAYRASAEQPQAAAKPSTPVPAKPAQSESRIPATDVSVAKVSPKNFVVTGAPPEICERIAQAAEENRREIAKLWLGKELPAWPKPCPIVVRINAESPGGATAFNFGNEFEAKSMQLFGTRQNILECGLPHEVTHCVIADHFRKPIPRWADEGIAVCSESADGQIRHGRMCREMLKQGRAIRLSSLLAMTDYPQDVSVMYAQGHSVIRFLISLKGRSQVLEFVRTGMKEGWETAAKRSYDFESISSLESAWIDSLRHEFDRAPPPTVTSNFESPPQIPPAQAPPAQAVIPPATAPQPTTPQLPYAQVETPPPSAPTQPGIGLPVELNETYGPIVVVDAIVKDGRIFCRFAKTTVMQEISSNHLVNGAMRQVISRVGRTVQEEHIYDLKAVEVLGTDGKPIDELGVPLRLAKETQALFVEGRRYDPRLLGLLEPHTLIISAPSSASPIPNPAGPMQSAEAPIPK